jgi:hypothetical protein
VDPAKDALCQKLQELLGGKDYSHRFSFLILSNAILFDQRVNPSFAAHFILQNIVGKDRPSSAHWYFTRTNNFFSKSAQLYARGETFDTLEWPKYPAKTGNVHGDVLPTANSTIADLRLKNVDAITPLTQPVRPKSAASRKPIEDRAVDREVYDREYEYHYRRPVCREIFTSGIDRYGDYYEKRITRCN